MLGILTAATVGRPPDPEAYLFAGKWTGPAPQLQNLPKPEPKRYWLLMLTCVSEDVVLGVYESREACDAAAAPIVAELEDKDTDQRDPLPQLLHARLQSTARCGDSNPVVLIRIEAGTNGTNPGTERTYYDFVG